MTQLVILFVAVPGSWTLSRYNIQHIVADSNSGNQNGCVHFFLLKKKNLDYYFFKIILEICILMTRQRELKSVASEGGSI